MRAVYGTAHGPYTRGMIRTILAIVALAALQSAARNDPQAAPAPIEVGTFNIRYANDGDGVNAWSHRRGIVLAIVREGDFWGLQEALPSQVSDIERGAPAMKVLVRSREKDASKGEACPILYRADRWTLDESDHGTFWLSETPDAAGSKSWDSSLPRICTFARFTERGGGRSLYVFNTHLDHQGPKARLEAARMVAARIAARRHDDPVVLVGDFNCGPTSEPVQALLGAKPAFLRDAWRTAHPEAPEQGTFNGWEPACGAERIDWIMVGGALEVRSADIDAEKRDGHWPSDHAFVRARLSWK